MTITSIKISEFGGPDVMQLVSEPCPTPQTGEVRVKLTAIGVNLIDTYHRTGLYPLPLPSGLGCEGAGVVDATGEGVDSLAIGDRVGFCMAMGAYSEAIIVPQTSLVKLPDGVSDAQAAAVLLKGMTVDYLFNETFALSGGETILFHAAAGGVGLLACQWAKHLGVSLIGTASTPAKCDMARAHGAAACLVLDEAALASGLRDELNALTDGKGFPVVYDSVGQATYQLSLQALAPLGTLVSFGNASGPIEAVSPSALAAAGSVYFTRPTLATHIARPGWMQKSANRLFDLMARKVINVDINQTYRLADVAQAHRDLEARITTGCSIIFP
jgi:NADPH2:quinone reductase